MKKLICIILTATILLLMVGCSLSIPALYSDLGIEYIEGIGSMTRSEAEKLAEEKDYSFSSSDDNTIMFTGKSDDALFLTFRNSMVSEVSYHLSKKSIDISKDKMYYWIGSNDIVYKDSLAECERMLFGAVSGNTFTATQTSPDTTTAITSSDDRDTTSYSSTYYSLKHGRLLDKTINGNTLILKAKIEVSYSNTATINQNYYNIEDIIKYQGGDKYTEIQYWAVADMTNGSENKVVSFTLSADVIKKIADGDIPANMIGTYADDLFIHQSLK